VAHVEKRGPGRWRARYRDPSGKERSRTFQRKIDADRWLSITEASKVTGEWIDPDLGKVTVEVWAWNWFEGTNHLRQSGRERDRSYLRTHILPVFGDRAISSIEHFEIVDWVAELNNRRKPATVRLAYGIFNRLMKAAVDRGLIGQNPCSGVKLRPIDNEEKRFLLPVEVARLAGCIDPRYRAYVLVAGYAGLRSGEMAALRPAQVDLSAGSIDVIASVSEVGGRLVEGPPKTRRGRRTIALPAEVVEELANHMEHWMGGTTVFGAPQGGVLRAAAWRRRFWHPAVQEANLGPLVPYALRDTAISFWIQAGGNVLEVSRRAGHSSVAFTLDRYGHLFPDADTELSGRLSVLYRGPQPVPIAPDAVESAVAASSRPDDAQIIFIGQQKEPVNWGVASGASKNRTCDLSIISAAL